MMYSVYILKNRKSGELYYGYTHNIERRLKEHDMIIGGNLLVVKGTQLNLMLEKEKEN